MEKVFDDVAFYWFLLAVSVARHSNRRVLCAWSVDRHFCAPGDGSGHRANVLLLPVDAQGEPPPPAHT